LIDEQAGKLTKADKQWLDMDGDGRYCEEPGVEWALFTRLRGIEILRTSPFGDSANFALTEFSEVRYPQATPKQQQR
jgi:hypothetical protein